VRAWDNHSLTIFATRCSAPRSELFTMVLSSNGSRPAQPNPNQPQVDTMLPDRIVSASKGGLANWFLC
jgi:hypothetical protein